LIKNVTALHDLEVAQKSAIADIFGLHRNSLVAPTLALADTPFMSVRKECLQHSRIIRLSQIFDSADWTDHALPYVSAGLGLPHPSTLLKFSSRSELLEELHFEPRRQRFTSLFNGYVTVECLRSIVAREIPWCESRMLLLWLFRKLNSFQLRPACRLCGSAPITQLHVATCGAIPLRLLNDPILMGAASSVDSSRLPVESVAQHLDSLEPFHHRRFIHRLSSVIFDAVIAVYGTRADLLAI